MAGGLSPTPFSHTSGIAALRAARRAVKVASVPPVVMVPPASLPKPASSHIHRITRVSIAVAAGDISPTAADWLSAPMRGSIQTAAGSGSDTWCPMYMGWARWMLLGITSDLTRRASSSRGTPSAGRGSSKRAYNSSRESGVETGPTPFRALVR